MCIRDSMRAAPKLTSGWMVYTDPVSYTHLDVYKRQYEDYSNQRKTKMILFYLVDYWGLKESKIWKNIYYI